MSRNSLTKPSNCTRTQHEHRSRSFDPRGARAEDGQGVGCWERWRVGTSCCAGKKRVACAFSNPAEQKKSHWTVPAPALLSPLMQPSAVDGMLFEAAVLEDAAPRRAYER